MKAILLSQNKQAFQTTELSIQKHLPELELEIVQSLDILTNKVINEAGLKLYLVDLSLGQENIELFFRTLEELYQDKPIICLSDGINLNEINKAFLLKNPNNAIVENYHEEHRLIEIIQSALENFDKLNQNEVVLEADEEEGLIALKIRNLFFYQQFPHDCYVKITSNRYIKAFEADQIITEKQILKFIHRGIRHAYVEKDKHIQFLEKTMDKARLFFQEKIELDKRTTMAHLRSLAVIHDYLRYIAVTQDIEDFIEDLSGHIIQTLSAAVDPVMAFLKTPLKFESVVGKSLLTAYLNFFLLEKLGWQAEVIQRRFLVASFLQDLFVDNDRMSKLKSLNDPQIKIFSEEDTRAYEKHHEKAAQIAEHFSHIKDISFLISQHHELPNRKGHPQQPSPAKMQIANCVFNTACQFAAEIDGQNFNRDNLKLLAKDYAKHFNQGNFREPSLKLADIFKS